MEPALSAVPATGRGRVNPIKLRKARVVGHTIAPAFVDWYDAQAGQMRGELRMVERDVYEGTGEVFRQARMDAGLSLRQAAERLGLSPAQMSSLEHGQMVPEDADEHARALRLLAARLERVPCSCCEKTNGRGCTDGPMGPCCPCCLGTGVEDG